MGGLMTAATPGPDPVHLMTIDMGCWCGASGPGNGRASSAWREVTCPACTGKRTEWLKSLVWDMLQSMPASSEALAVAVRAGRLGVTDERGRPLAMACAAGQACGCIEDEAERARALGVPKPPPVMSGQGSLFDQEAS